MSETATTVAEPDDLPVPDGELRLALAMRGGVSLAVWIGGAVAEVDRMCRATDERDPYWAWLRRLSGYDAAIVDVMSGASAGGLNAVIASAAMVYDFPLDGLRRLWVDVGSLGKMVRRRGRPRRDGSDGISLLEGDEYFLAKLDESLVALVESGRNGEAGRARRVDVTLAATLLEPIAVQRVRGMADTTELRYESTFRFRHGGPARTDYPHDPEARRAAIARLALAGRATSSFPAAFEAAEVHAPRPATFSTGVPTHIDGHVSMTDVFGESTAGGRAFCVMDGGVLDNIPIARAIDGIVEAPADGPTRRVLVYVQPGSAGVAPDAPSGAPDRSTTAVVTALVRTRVQEETIAVDLRQIDLHNRRARRARLGAVAAIRALDPHPLRPAVDEAPPDHATQLLLNRYGAQRAGQETSSITQLLDDPIGTLGHDPFPALDDLTPVEVDRRWRAPLSEAWRTVWAQQLGSALARHLTERFTSAVTKSGHALTATSGPLRRLTIMLIDACNAVHRCATTDGERDAANRMKAALYRILAVHTELVERPRRLGWVVLAVRRREPSEVWLDRALTRLDALTADADELGIDAYLDADHWSPGTSTPLAPAEAVMRERLDCLLLGRPLDGDGEDVRDVLLARLADAASHLATICQVDAGRLTQLAEGNDLGAALLAWLRSSPETSREAWIGRLAALEAATFDPESPDGPGHRPIDFVRLSGANPTPLAAAFPALAGTDVPEDPWADVVERLQDEAASLGDDAKLAGNTLMNFAAFLREHWRENDWMWGRMDAVVTLVDVLVEPARLRQLITAMEPGHDRVERLRRWFRRAVTQPDGAATSEAWRSFLDVAVWQPRAAAIEAALAKAVAEVAEPPGPDAARATLSATDLRPLRTALVAARQWQILAELLPPTAPEGGPSPSPRDVVERANTYAVGRETVQNPPDQGDRELVQQLAGATRAMLERPCGGAISKATRAGALLVRLLDWLWLDPTDHPRRWGALLALLGLVGVSVPVALAVDGTANGVVAGAAGIAGLVTVVGAALLVVAGLRIPTGPMAGRVGLVLLVVGVLLGVVVGLAGGLVALSVVAAVVAVPVLVTGVTILGVAGVVPRLVRRAGARASGQRTPTRTIA